MDDESDIETQVERAWAELKAFLPRVAQIDSPELHRSTVALQSGLVTLRLRPPSLHINFPSELAKRQIDGKWWIARFTAVEAKYHA